MNNRPRKGNHKGCPYTAMDTAHSTMGPAK